jgi:broad specificity phosphatase PhoE
MSEQEKQKSSFMEELDRWTEATVIGPLIVSETGDEDWEVVAERVKKAIRTKVLESYRNGQAAGPKQPQKQWQRKREFQR